MKSRPLIVRLVPLSFACIQADIEVGATRFDSLQSGFAKDGHVWHGQASIGRWRLYGEALSACAFCLVGRGHCSYRDQGFLVFGRPVFSGEGISSAHQTCSDEKRQGIVSHLSSSARIQLAIHAAIWLARSAAALAAQARARHQALWPDAGRIWVLGVCWPVRRRFLKAENSQARMASTRV